MKNITFSKVLPMVAVIAALGAAIVPAHKSGAQGSTQYYWFDANKNYLGVHASSSSAKTTLGCTTGNNICALGFRSDQLADPNDPDAGLANGVNNSDKQDELKRP